MSKRCDAEERWQNCERAYCQQFMKCSVAASSEPVSKLSVTSPAPTPSQQEAQWQPIETAPKDGTGISIKLTDGSVLQNVIPQSDGDYWWNGVQELFIPEFKVTHWMPLPTRPDEVTK